MSTLVQVTLVCKHIKVDGMRPVRWERGGYIKKVKRGNYLLSELDAFLAECAKNFPAPLTWHELQSKTVVLLQPDEAKAEFGVTEEQLYMLRRNNSIAFVSLPGKAGSIRYSRESLQKVLAPGKPSLISTQAAHILGHDTDQAVRRLARQKVLETVYVPLDHQRVYVSIESLSAFLTERLRKWINVERWIKYCQASPNSLVRAGDAAIFLDYDPKQLLTYLEEKQAWFINSPDGKNVRVLQWWLDQQLDNDKRYSVRMVAQLFDVEPAEVWHWLNLGLITCPVQIHEHGEHTSFLWEPCWSAIIEATSSPHAKRVGRTFILERSRPDPPKLWGVREAAVELCCSRGKLEQLAQTGALFGIRTPAGDWRFNAAHVREYGRKASR
ncbi:MAG TPA: hypothetical protein VM581_03035 [Magnetospirillaceae bacterium]|nr:hypothetical protein [Magnetospirillaceae bacterium]